MSWEKVQVTYDGHKRDFDLSALELEDPSNPTDEQLKYALNLVIEGDLGNDYVVDRTSDTILNVRPDATLA